MFTIQDRYSDKLIYRNLKVTEHLRPGVKVAMFLAVLVIAAPVVLMYLFGIQAVVSIVGAGLVLVGMFIVVSDTYLQWRCTEETFDRVVVAKTRQTRRLVEQMEMLMQYEQELSAFVIPVQLYEEIMDNIENYAQLVKLEQESVIEDYSKKLEQLYNTCVSRRKETLTTNGNVLDNAIIASGELPRI